MQTSFHLVFCIKAIHDSHALSPMMVNKAAGLHPILKPQQVE